MDLMAMLTKVLTKNGLIFAFVLIGLTNLVAYKLAGLTKGRIHGSAVAIFFGLFWLISATVLRVLLPFLCLPVSV